MIGMFPIIDSSLLLSCICYYLVISLFTALYFSLRSIIVHYRQLNHRQSGLIFRDIWALTRLVKHLPHAILTAKSCLASDSFCPSTVAVNLALPEDYAKTISSIRTRTYFALLRSALICLRGSRARRKAFCNFKNIDIDVEIQGRAIM